MERRTIVKTIPLVGSTVLIAGCLRSLNPGVDLVINNTDSTTHDYDITASGNFDTRSATGQLDSSKSTTASDFIPRRDDTHIVELEIDIDDDSIRSIDIVINSTQDIEIDIINSEGIELQPSEIISPSN